MRLKLFCTYSIPLNTYILTTYMDDLGGVLVTYLEMKSKYYASCFSTVRTLEALAS